MKTIGACELQDEQSCYMYNIMLQLLQLVVKVYKVNNSVSLSTSLFCAELKRFYAMCVVVNGKFMSDRCGDM